MQLPINKNNSPIKNDYLKNAYFCAYLDLRQDLLFDKIPKKSILFMINKVFKNVEQYVPVNAGQDIRQTIDSDNIKVELKKKNLSFFNLHLRAQFKNNQDGNTITIYSDSLKDLSETLELDQESILSIVLTHEYFHYLELINSIDIGDKLQYKAVFGIKRESSINRLSEIAANRFTQQYLKLSFLPSAMDYQYLLVKGDLSESYLNDEYNNFKQL